MLSQISVDLTVLCLPWGGSCSNSGVGREDSKTVNTRFPPSVLRVMQI